jgi:probable addiction module antidote protein
MKLVSAPKTQPFDAAEHLRDDDDIAEYLRQVLEEGDPGELAEALGTAAKARGMSAVARQAGIGRESLYRALRAGADPRFETVQRVCAALGLKLTLTPANSTQTAAK